MKSLRCSNRAGAPPTLRLGRNLPFDDEASAYVYLEEVRWQGRPVCPHCGNEDRCYFLIPANGRTRRTRTGASTPRRVWKCGACRKQFSVLTGTGMHGTKIPVQAWAGVLSEPMENGREAARKYGLTPHAGAHLVRVGREVRAALRSGGSTS